METLGQRAKGWEDTLYVHDDGLAGSRQHHVLLLQEVSGHGDSPSHSDFIGGTAHASHIDSLGSHRFCQFQHFRIFGVFTDHLRKTGIMTVYDNINAFFFHNAQVGFRIHRLWRSEHNV